MHRFEPHSHTMYSNIRLLDSINRPDKLIAQTQEIGLAGIAITDHESLSCHIEVNKIAANLKESNPDFKIALGNEIYLTDTRENGQKYWHFILIAKDAQGHRQLRELSSLAWLNSYWDRGLERVPTLKSDLERIVKNNPGHLIATSACIGGELSGTTLIMENARHIGDTTTAEVAKNNIINFVFWCKEVFGEDFYIECAPGASRDQIIVNKKLAELAPQFGVKMIIGSDAHYLKKEDRYVHKAYLNSKGGEREVDDFYEYAYLQNEEDIIKNLTPSIVDSYEQMCQNSMEIYDKIEFYDLTHPQVIPSVEVKDYPKAPAAQIPSVNENKYPILNSMLSSNDKYERYWANECLYKLELKNLNNEIYLSRLEEEADIKRTIGEKLGTNMFAYPITLQHYIDMFWECGSTVGAGRGSSCSGLNHYLLGVTQLDPIEWNLPFWRYLNKERVELGDIDIDLCPSKRPIIIQKIKEERGQNFNDNIDEISRRNLGCTLIATFGTESTKSTILTACRGYRSENFPDGIDNDIAQYMSSLIPQERGFLWTLDDVLNGNEEKGRKPVGPFINEVNQYPGLVEIMKGIEGLVSRRGSHASGVIMFDEDPYEFGCFMRTPSGEVVTQYDLHMAEAAGMTKYDFLLTEVQDKITQCIKFLQEDGEIESDLTLKEVYDKYFHPNVLNINDEEVWKNIQENNILNIFQFDSDVGSQAAKKIKPSTMLELSDANGLMRLMTSEKGAETPMEKYIRFKNNLNLWYDEMKKYGLTKKEMEVVTPYFKESYGVPPSQEQMMRMLMDENICNFSLKDANAARKIVGKKQMNKIPELKKQVFTQAASPALGNYIWECGIGPQMGYSFSIIHALAYSFIGYQTAYLATKWNPIYWDTACLVVNSGSLEEEESEIVSIYEKEDEDYTYEDLPNRTGKKKEKNSDYAKIAKAIGDITSRGIEVSLVNINTSDYGFQPDVENNRILYGLKALSNINSETVEAIKAGRPYQGIKDFIIRCPLTKTAMINLIKAGAFDEIETDLPSRKHIMAYYISKICEPKKRLTLQNWNGLVQHGLIPAELEMQIRIYNFTKYIKTNCKVGQYFQFNDICMQFFEKFMPNILDQVETINGVFCMEQKAWDKIYQSKMDLARDWLKANQEEVLKKYNTMLFQEVWNKYAEGNDSHWEMESVCFYHSPHELKDININKYDLSDFNKLESNEIDYFFKRKGIDIPIYKLYRIIGTVIAKNDNKHTVILLTTTGVVTVKFTREYYSMFKKQISQIQPNGTKKVVEKSWFKRGTMLMITGFRRDDMFVAKTYASSCTHQLYKITDIVGDEMKLQHERITVNNSMEEDYEDG